MTTPNRTFIAAIVFFALLLGGCGSKDIPFTDYLVENLLRDNLASLAEPPIFEVVQLRVKQKSSADAVATAEVDVELYFPEDFDTVVQLRKLEPFNVEYLQYQSSFGKFSAGETQIHHASYQFQKRGNKWVIIGSKAIAPPDVSKPE